MTEPSTGAGGTALVAPESVEASDYVAQVAGKKASKYRNKRVKEDGYTFDSIAEWDRYRQLKLMMVAGEITAIEVHPRFPLMVNDVRICTYVADFQYRTSDGRVVTEDVKGMRTQVYQIKRKLMKAVWHIDVQEVEAA